MIEWYLKVVRDNYATFSGRARRSEYWYFVLFNIIIGIILGIIDSVIGIDLLGTIYSLVVLIPSLAVGIRRLHDVGKSGWFTLIILIPLIGAIWLIVLYATEGDRGANEYGEDPKADYNEFEDIGKPEA
ncbi:DUF805 domain-containing protein [Flavobacterium arcticum]|uniref:DUF805 domain-containing protein n=1 Tax=Flavobacterium arcticum TaxID=1784713 RepID=A0A345HB63_9FLAO|nr:DUF805 domain-containing protein [Flavobacterium arcticum]AXG73823.1 DUF805 domain-containing protein [Flavobacterium arcticum]KAF2511775.1 DUF805 domain-containing protein [Flavobacterium arcticum]